MIDIFPYSNLHNLNLDWVIATVKEVADSMKLTAEQISVLEASIRNLESIVDYDAPCCSDSGHAQQKRNPY